ncbi:MAG: lipopolysaccharide heptosyltransferase II [Janthinobacterium lividum]
MRRVLVVAPNWIGDALMAQPLLALLRKLHPRAEIDALAPPSVAPVLERMPEVANVISMPFKHGRLQLWQRLQLAGDLREQGYQAAYVLPNSAKAALVPWLAGIGLRIGYRGEHRYGLLNVRHAEPARARRGAAGSASGSVPPRPPMARHYAALAYAPGATLPENLPSTRLEYDLNETVRISHRFNLDTRLPVIVLCPGAEYGPAKRWPPEHFAALSHLLRQSFPYAQIVAVGTQNDAAAARAIIEQAPFVRDLCGQTSLTEACALIARAAAVVSNDSGLMHVAAGLNRPLVALYGSTDPRHTPPLSDTAQVQWLHLDCSPCFERQCPLGHLNCLRQLTPEQVFETLRAMLHAER